MRTREPMEIAAKSRPGSKASRRGGGEAAEGEMEQRAVAAGGRADGAGRMRGGLSFEKSGAPAAVSPGPNQRARASFSDEQAASSAMIAGEDRAEGRIEVSQGHERCL